MMYVVNLVPYSVHYTCCLVFGQLIYFLKRYVQKTNLKVSDKHWAIILSYICVAISGGIISIQCGSSEYLTVSSIAISVLIGSYISVETFLKN